MTVTVPVPSVKNWKTSLIGLISLLVSLIRIVMDANKATLDAALHDPLVWITLLVAIQGFISKDSNVTGGTVGQPSTEKAIVESNHAPATGLAAPVDVAVQPVVLQPMVQHAAPTIPTEQPITPATAPPAPPAHQP